MARNDSPVMTEVSRLSHGTKMTGTLVSSTDIRVDGEFEGRIQTSGKVVIGNTATVKGDIVAGSADIWGTVSGNIITGDALSLKEGSHVEATLEVVRISVEMGAEFNGSCRMIAAGDFESRLNMKDPEAGKKK